MLPAHFFVCLFVWLVFFSAFTKPSTLLQIIREGNIVPHHFSDEILRKERGQWSLGFTESAISI